MAKCLPNCSATNSVGNTSSLIVHVLTVGQMAENCYLLEDSSTQSVLIIDPGDDAEYISDRIESMKGRPVGIYATHGHMDHIMAAFALTHLYSIPFFMNMADSFLLPQLRTSAKHYLGIESDPPPHVEKSLSGNTPIYFGKHRIDIIETPGHTPGSVSLYVQRSAILFSGDVLFDQGGIGRTDFSYSNQKDFSGSVEKILKLPDNTMVYPGHGNAFTLQGYKHSSTSVK